MPQARKIQPRKASATLARKTRPATPRPTTKPETQMPTKTSSDTATIPTFDSKALTEQFLAGVKQNNQATLDAVSAWVSSVSSYVATLPAMPQAAPAVTIPGLPTEAEQRAATLAGFDFMSELVSVQKEFAANYFNALAPLAPKG
jgi:hypothetical protein